MENIFAARQSEDSQRVFEECENLLRDRGLIQQLGVLCEVTNEDYKNVEQAVHSLCPGLPAAEVDTAAYDTIKRLWRVATRVLVESPLACPTAEEFKTQLYKLLKPCVRFSAYDAMRKYSRQMDILEHRFFSYWEIQHSDPSLPNERIGPKESENVLEAIKEELVSLDCKKATAVLEAMKHANWDCGGLNLSGKRYPSNDWIASWVQKNLGIRLNDHDIEAARKRVKDAAISAFKKNNWCVQDLLTLFQSENERK